MFIPRLFAVVVLTLTLGITAVSGAARAEPEASGPGGFIEDLADRALDMLTSPSISTEERNERFRSLLVNNFDVPAVGRFVLGRYWRLSTEEERQEFLVLFEELVVRTYASRFGGYSGETFQINEVRDLQNKDAVVLSEIVRPAGGPPVRLDWRVRGPNSTYRIVDLSIEGVSMALTQRSEFSAVIQREGGNIAGLIASLRRKVESLKRKDQEATLQQNQPDMVSQ
jgi:phospholipid transport system substrate-binding protein